MADAVRDGNWKRLLEKKLEVRGLGFVLCASDSEDTKKNDKKENNRCMKCKKNRIV